MQKANNRALFVCIIEMDAVSDTGNNIQETE